MPPTMSVLPFYEASLRALRFLEARSPTKRRFGPEADALWKSFRGHLSAADRLDLLLRDADIQIPGAFGARVAFDLRGVSEDDAFGAEWTSLEGAAADALFRKVLAEPVGSDVPSVLTACAQAWGITLAPLDVPAPRPAERLAVVGPSAIVALAARFEGRPELSFGAQVTCFATPPGHRQLAALAAAVLSAERTPDVVSVRREVKAGFDRVVSSPDADAEDRAHLARLTGSAS